MQSNGLSNNELRTPLEVGVEEESQAGFRTFAPKGKYHERTRILSSVAYTRAA